MKIYRIKKVEQEEVDCGLLGSNWTTYESLLNEVYATEEVAKKHLPENKAGEYSTIEYSIVEQELINE